MDPGKCGPTSGNSEIQSFSKDRPKTLRFTSDPLDQLARPMKSRDADLSLRLRSPAVMRLRPS